MNCVEVVLWIDYAFFEKMQSRNEACFVQKELKEKKSIKRKWRGVGNCCCTKNTINKLNDLNQVALSHQNYNIMNNIQI